MTATAESPKPAPITFFGISLADARSVVYVIDRSGSMTDSIDYVKYEMKRSIGTLREDQEFDIMWYTSGPVVEMPPKRLVSPTERNKQLAFEFIDSIVASGETDPGNALRRALDLKPDVIVVLTDGEWDSTIADTFNRLNADKKVKVHGIGFLWQDCGEVLRQIVAENGGQYKFIAEADLQEMTSDP